MMLHRRAWAALLAALALLVTGLAAPVLAQAQTDTPEPLDDRVSAAEDLFADESENVTAQAKSQNCI